MHSLEERDALSELSHVLKQPAFIAGIGATCWAFLMVFSVWLYRHRKKRSGLSSSYTGIRKVPSFTFTPTGRPGHLNMGDPLNQVWLADNNWPNGCSSHKDRSVNCCNNAIGPGDSNMITYSRPADCIANYGSHLVTKREGGGEGDTLGSDNAIYSDLNLCDVVNLGDAFDGAGLCYVGPGGGPTYEPVPYATTQLIQSAIQRRPAPHPPPAPREMTAPGQYNLLEHNRVNKDHFSGGSEGIPQNTIPYNEVRGQISNLLVDRVSVSPNHKKGGRNNNNVPKQSAGTWASLPPQDWVTDEYSLPMGKSSEPDSQRPAVPKRTARHQGNALEEEEEEEEMEMEMEEGRTEMMMMMMCVERRDGCPAPPLRGVSSSSSAPQPSSAAELFHAPQASAGVPVQVAQGPPPRRDGPPARHRCLPPPPQTLMPTYDYASSPSPLPSPPLILDTEMAEEDPDADEEDDDDDDEEEEEEEEEEEQADIELSSGQRHHHRHRHPQQRRETPHTQHQQRWSPQRIQLRGLPPTPAPGGGAAAAAAEPSGRVPGSGVNSWASASEDNLSSARSSVGSTSEGSLFAGADRCPSPGGSGDAAGLQWHLEETGSADPLLLLLSTGPSLPSIPAPRGPDSLLSSGASRTTDEEVPTELEAFQTSLAEEEEEEGEA
ncbi:unnamed protein product [Merluccius merluccius]